MVYNWKYYLVIHADEKFCKVQTLEELYEEKIFRLSFVLIFCNS